MTTALRTPTTRFTTIPWLMAGLALVVHFFALEGYGWFRDELYYVACGRHPEWGYVDHPPLVGWVAAAVLALFGPREVKMLAMSPLAFLGEQFLLAGPLGVVCHGRSPCRPCTVVWRGGPMTPIRPDRYGSRPFQRVILCPGRLSKVTGGSLPPSVVQASRKADRITHWVPTAQTYRIGVNTEINP